MRKLLILMLVIAALCVTAAAYEVPTDFSDLTLEEAVEDFKEFYQLTENNFSMSFYNTVTGESFDFNEKKFSIAASTYKLPLNMCFYEMAQEGKIDPDEQFMWTGMTLSEVQRQSILFSNNEVSEAMTAYWNNYYIYKENMRKYSSMPVEEIDEQFYLTNVSCTRLMIDTLKYLYDNSDKFEVLIGHMKQAVEGQYFKAGVTEFEIAHKYGAIHEFVNDVGIIYTPQPILLAVYTQGVYGTGICAQAARLMTNYTVWQLENETEVSAEVKPEELPEEPTVTEELPEEETVPEEETETETPTEDPVETPAEEPSEPIPEEQTEIQTEGQEPVQEDVSSEEDEEMTIEEILREQQVAQERKKRDARIVWSIIGVESILLLVAIPVIIRRRY